MPKRSENMIKIIDVGINDRKYLKRRYNEENAFFLISAILKRLSTKKDSKSLNG